MTDEQKAAYVHAQAVVAQIEMQGMIAENNMRAYHGEAPAYVEKDFIALIDRNGIHHNGLIGLFHNHP